MLTTGIAIAAMVLGAAGLARLLAPAPPRYSQKNVLAAERRQLARKGAESREVIADRKEVIRELRRLRRRMQEVDPQLYAARIQRLDAGVALLRRQIELEEELIREYARADEMLDVEIETLRVAGRLEEDSVDRITARLDELEAIREMNRDLQLQLEANEEVERLLLHGEEAPT
jgi:hypothetical protein